VERRPWRYWAIGPPKVDVNWRQYSQCQEAEHFFSTQSLKQGRSPETDSCLAVPSYVTLVNITAWVTTHHRAHLYRMKFEILFNIIVLLVPTSPKLYRPSGFADLKLVLISHLPRSFYIPTILPSMFWSYQHQLNGAETMQSIWWAWYEVSNWQDDRFCSDRLCVRTACWYLFPGGKAARVLSYPLTLTKCRCSDWMLLYRNFAILPHVRRASDHPPAVGVFASQPVSQAGRQAASQSCY
jgi:hypothetical protein